MSASDMIVTSKDARACTFDGSTPKTTLLTLSRFFRPLHPVPRTNEDAAMDMAQ